MKMILMLKGGNRAMLKAMGSEVRTGKYYNKAGKVALHIKGKSNYHFDYSKGKKSGHAEHSKYGKMTSGLKHQSEFQKQAGKSKGKVVKIKAGTHAEKRRDKKGKVVTRHVSNKPKVKGTTQRAGSKVNEVKPSPKQSGKNEPVVKHDNALAAPKERYFDGNTGKEISKEQHAALVELANKNSSPSKIDSAISGAQQRIGVSDEYKDHLAGIKLKYKTDKPVIKIKGMKRDLSKEYKREYTVPPAKYIKPSLPITSKDVSSFTNENLDKKIKYHQEKVDVHTGRLKELTAKTGGKLTKQHSSILKQQKYHNEAMDSAYAEQKKRTAKHERKTPRRQRR